FDHADLKTADAKLISVIWGQDMSDHVATRELVQNSRDAVREQYPEYRPPIKVDSFLRQGSHEWVRRFSDEAGMELGVVAGPLLVADVTTKMGKKLAGLFGQGFYTLFVDFDRIRIKTGNGNRTFFILLTKDARTGLPVIEQFVETDEKLRGTTIEWVRDYAEEPPYLEALFLSQDMIRYVGASQDVEILYNGRPVNEALDTSSTANTTLGPVKVSLSPLSYHRRLTQDDLYVGAVEKWIFDLVPPKFRLHLVRKGINIDIPDTVPVTRTRIGIALQELYQKSLQQAVAANAFKLSVLLYLKRGLLPPGLGEDFFRDVNVNPATNPEDKIDPKVIADAERINENRVNEVDFERYVVRPGDDDATKEKKILDAADLVALIEVEFEGIRLNLWEYRRVKMIEALERDASAAEALRKRFAAVEKGMAQALREDLDAARIQIVDMEMERKRELPLVPISEEDVRSSPSLYLLKTFYEKILSVVGTQDPIAIEFYYKVEGRVADFGSSLIRFNLHHAFKVISELDRLLKRDDPEAAFVFFRKQLDTTLHELSHYGEDLGSPTHQPEDIEIEKKFKPPHWIGEEELEALVGLFGWRVRQNIARYLSANGKGAWQSLAADLKRAFPEGAKDLKELQESVLGRARSEVRQTAGHVVLHLFGKESFLGVRLESLAGSIETYTVELGIAEFGRILRSEARSQLRGVEEIESQNPSIDPGTLQEQNARSKLALAWLTEVFNTLDGSVAVAVNAKGQKDILREAFRPIAGRSQIVALLAGGTELEMDHVKKKSVGRLDRLRPRPYWGEGIMVENDQFIPVVQIGGQIEKVEANRGLLPVESTQPAVKAFGSFAPVVDAASRLLIAGLTGHEVKDVSELGRSEVRRKIVGALLKNHPELLNEIPDIVDMIQFNGRSLAVNQTLIALVTDYLARSEIRKSA
ncbi:MAG TPA: hypothetical protein VD913_03600, partial [bacterium]|nr:hypothetical protein [bacterium]